MAESKLENETNAVNFDKQESPLEELLQCPICHNILADVTITQCGHRFCTPCIRQWVLQKYSCPTCRRMLFVKCLIQDRDFGEIVSKVQELENDVIAAKIDRILYLEQKKTLQDDFDQIVQELQKTKDLLGESREEITGLKMDIQSYKDKIKENEAEIIETNEILVWTIGQRHALRNDLQLLTEELQDTKDLLDPMRDEITGLTTEGKICKAELEEARQQCLQYQKQVLELQVFKDMLKEKQEELEDLKDTKDAMINQLQLKTDDLANELADLRRNTIPLDQHALTLQSELQQTFQNLQLYFESKYGNKITRADELNDALQQQVCGLENKLQYRLDVGDELKTAVRTYKNLLKVNSDFQDTVDEKDKQIRCLQHELAHSKERTYTLERKMSLYSNLRKD